MDRCAAIVQRAPAGAFVPLRTDGGSGTLELGVGGAILLPHEIGWALARREARGYACMAAALDGMDALFLLRRAARSRMRRAAHSVTGL